MKLNIKLFATLKTRAETSQVAVELNHLPATVKDLLAELGRQNPVLESSLKSVLVAVNHEFAFAEQVINPGDEIALFPPVSGG